jgi:glycosyltransferase involved in cell wall biosynthesis
MHALIFNQFFTTNDVPGSGRAYELGRGLVNQGDSVTYVTGDSIYFTGKKTGGRRLLWSKERVDGIEVIRVTIPFGDSWRIPLRIFGFLWFIPFGFLAALRVRSPDIVVATSTPLSIGLPGYMLSRLRGIPFVFELRDLWPDAAVSFNRVRSRLLLWAAYRLESFLYRKASAIIALTRGIRQEVIAKGIPARKVSVITNAADLELFRPDGPRADLRAKTGVPDDAFVCIFSGSLVPTAALELIIEAADQLRERRDIHFVFLGAGPRRDPLEAEVTRRKLQSVHFLDPVPKCQVPAFLRAADTALIFSDPVSLAYLNLPNKFFDYTACGCPVVLNFDGEARQYLESTNAGIYVPPNNAGAIADAIRDLSASPQKVRQMRENARRLAEKAFGWNHKTVEFRAVLASVLSRASNHAHFDAVPQVGPQHEIPVPDSQARD